MGDELTLKGLDVSEFNATLTKAACAPWDVVWARATRGPSHVDTHWKANKAVLSGIAHPGAYHAITGESGGAFQADFFLGQLPADLTGWSLFVDWETEPSTAVLGQVMDFISEVKRRGYPCGLYASDAWWSWSKIGQGWNFIARYPDPPVNPADVHQYEAVAGIGDHSHILSDLSVITIGGDMGTADTYFDDLKANGIGAGDYRGNQAFTVGLRCGARGIALPADLADNADAEAGLAAWAILAASGGGLPAHAHKPGTGNTGGVA